jgi:hypothetical protein
MAAAIARICSFPEGEAITDRIRAMANASPTTAQTIASGTPEASIKFAAIGNIKLNPFSRRCGSLWGLL